MSKTKKTKSKTGYTKAQAVQDLLEAGGNSPDAKPTPFFESLAEAIADPLPVGHAKVFQGGKKIYEDPQSQWDSRTMPEPPWQDKQAFIEFLESTLIPDLRRSGSDATADDFVTCIKFMKPRIKELTQSDGEAMAAAEQCYEEVESLLEDWGGQLMLQCMGSILQKLEGAGNAAYVGKAIEALAEVDW